MRVFGNAFQRLCWRVKRELRNNRKPILLLFGNGYESQILLSVLNHLNKKCTIVHVAHGKLNSKTIRVFHHFRQHNHLIMRPYEASKHYKTFTVGDAVCPDVLDFGFSHKDYLIMAGFKLSEPILTKAHERGLFKNMYCPLLRYSNDWIETLYQDMKDNETIGDFMFDNLNSDSHHPTINIH